MGFIQGLGFRVAFNYQWHFVLNERKVPFRFRLIASRPKVVPLHYARFRMEMDSMFTSFGA